jgi:hypothetical protein
MSHDLRDVFVQVVSRKIKQKLLVVCQEHCYGCRPDTDDSNQATHDVCSMLPIHRQLLNYLPEALQLLDMDEIWELFTDELVVQTDAGNMAPSPLSPCIGFAEYDTDIQLQADIAVKMLQDAEDGQEYMWRTSQADINNFKDIYLWWHGPDSHEWWETNGKKEEKNPEEEK